MRAHRTSCQIPCTFHVHETTTSVEKDQETILRIVSIENGVQNVTVYSTKSYGFRTKSHVETSCSKNHRAHFSTTFFHWQMLGNKAVTRLALIVTNFCLDKNTCFVVQSGGVGGSETKRTIDTARSDETKYASRSELNRTSPGRAHLPDREGHNARSEERVQRPLMTSARIAWNVPPFVGKHESHGGPCYQKPRLI